MCMYNMVHPRTGEFIRKDFKLLTNAPWLMRLNRRCDRSHVHTVLEGKYTTYSAVYPWEWCVEYARALKTAPQFLKLMSQNRAVTRPDEFRVTVLKRAVTGYWPETPLTYLRGPLREQVLEYRVAVGQGKRSRYDVDQSQYDEEFYMLAEWLSKQGVPSTRVHRVERLDGTENWVVHFANPIVDIRDGKEKMSLNFQAYGVHHSRSMGTEKAASLAYYAYVASMQEGLGRYGVGRIKANGCHGNDNNEFRVYPVSALGSSKNYVPMKAFC